MKINNQMRFALAALAAVGFSSAAMADSAETKGGLTVKSDDGRFEFKLGGRLHLDAYAFGEDEDTTADTTESGMFLRRGYLSSTGKLYGWKFKHEFDLAASSSAQSAWRETWVSTEALGGEIIIGQFKPFRGMEELTSSNEILFLERPYASASGVYNGRQYQMGVGYKLPFQSGLWALSAVNTHAIGGNANQGIGLSTRLTFTPVNAEGSIVHLGISAGSDNADRSNITLNNTAPGPGSVAIAGRNSSTQVVSPTQSIGTADDSQDTIGLEAAAALGAFFIQSEYAMSTLKMQTADDQAVNTYYAAFSWFVTGETKPYRADRATFGSPKPLGENGAWELVARYDFIGNPDAAAEPEVTQITAGVNWYANPNVRFMFNYSIGKAETTAPDPRELAAIALRTQLSF